MKKKEVEILLKKISSEEPLYLSENEFRIIERMVNEGLIKPNHEGYSLTEYGKIIEIVGYDGRKSQKPGEEITSNSVFPESILLLLGWLAALISVLTFLFYFNT